MNRAKKEELKKYNEARKGLSKAEIEVLDKEDIIKKQIEKLAHTIHSEKFSEEYDFMYDSIADAKDRNSGINPMSQEYIDKIRKKRNDIGVSQLSENGTAISDETYILCLDEARTIINNKISNQQ